MVGEARDRNSSGRLQCLPAEMKFGSAAAAVPASSALVLRPAIPPRRAPRELEAKPACAALNRLRIAIGAAAVEIDQNIARLRAFARADNAAVFQFIHDARRASITEAQPPLQERHAGFLFAANHFNALLDDFFVL